MNFFHQVSPYLCGIEMMGKGAEAAWLDEGCSRRFDINGAAGSSGSSGSAGSGGSAAPVVSPASAMADG